MKPEIAIRIDLASATGDYTAIVACKKRTDGPIMQLDLLIVHPGDLNYNRKLREFGLKWHPNFFRRWLFRLFGP